MPMWHNALSGSDRECTWQTKQKYKVILLFCCQLNQSDKNLNFESIQDPVVLMGTLQCWAKETLRAVFYEAKVPAASTI